MGPETGNHGARHASGAHEQTDAGVRSAGILGGAFVILLVFGLVTGYLAFRFFNSPETVGPPASPIAATARVVPKGPRLQVNAHQDLIDYLNQQQHVLNSYGWVDQKAGVVRIPIEQAMDEVLKNGLPTRGAESSGKAATAAQKSAAITAKPAIPVAR